MSGVTTSEWAPGHPFWMTRKSQPRDHGGEELLGKGASQSQDPEASKDLTVFGDQKEGQQ